MLHVSFRKLWLCSDCANLFFWFLGMSYNRFLPMQVILLITICNFSARANSIFTSSGLCSLSLACRCHYGALRKGKNPVQMEFGQICRNSDRKSAPAVQNHEEKSICWKNARIVYPTRSTTLFLPKPGSVLCWHHVSLTLLAVSCPKYPIKLIYHFTSLPL